MAIALPLRHRGVHVGRDYADESSARSLPASIEPVMPRVYIVDAVLCGSVCIFAAALFWKWNAHCVTPADFGALTQSADRVYGGELPHVDYDSLYTGALSTVNALAFKLLGNTFAAMQMTLAAFGLAFIAAMYAIARHVVGPVTAALTTLLCLAWSLPNYFVGMPSWYNLFFATFGTLLLLRYIDDGRRRWLWAAGACAGSSIAVKIVGLYFVAAVLLYLVYRQQELSANVESQIANASLRRREAKRRVRHPLDLFAAALTMIGLCAFVGSVIALVLYRPEVPEIVHFVAPGALLAALLVIREMRLGGYGAWQRLNQLIGEAGMFVAGAAIPIAPFIVPYMTHSELLALIRGLLSSTTRFSESVTILGLPETSILFVALPVAAVALACVVGRRAVNSTVVWIALAAVLIVCLAAGSTGPVYRSVWQAARASVPLLAIGTFVLLNSQRLTAALASNRQQQVFLLSAVAAMVSLIQIPFAQGIYFFYAAPLVVLGLLFYLSAQPGVPDRLVQTVGVAFGLFAMLWLHGAASPEYGRRYIPYVSSPIQIDRCRSLRLDPLAAKEYELVVSEIQKHSRPGSYIYAAPDCPEIYYFANRKNPTRTFYELFDSDFHKPEREARILAQLDEHDVDVVLLNYHVPISGVIAPHFEAELTRRYPQGVQYVLPGMKTPHMVVRWRNKTDARLADSTGGLR
ncbi:MAG TPA: glycosyltransferase family 39 protein [Pirellulales bacterium]|jgi:hypothetical protein|nr:glycosyltransferase family 39 protein [Pirellulales bacterium]